MNNTQKLRNFLQSEIKLGKGILKISDPHFNNSKEIEIIKVSVDKVEELSDNEISSILKDHFKALEVLMSTDRGATLYDLLGRSKNDSCEVLSGRAREMKEIYEILFGG